MSRNACACAWKLGKVAAVGPPCVSKITGNGPSPSGTPSQAWSWAVPSVVGNETLRSVCPGGTAPLSRIVLVWRPVSGSRPIRRRGWAKSSQRQTISAPSGR